MILVTILTFGMIGYWLWKLYQERDLITKDVLHVLFKKKRQLTKGEECAFLIVHGILGVLIGVGTFWINLGKETSVLGKMAFAVLAALFFIMLLLFSYYIVSMVIYGIRAMRDLSVNLIMAYSLIVTIVMFYEIHNKNFAQVGVLILVNIALYLVNLVSISKIIIGILNKKIWLKSIWGIAIIDMLFMLVALTDITFLIQHSYVGDVYSREITSLGDAFYFVVISFFTVGYGDLYPTCEVTKMISMAVILTGFVFSAIFVSAALSTTMESFANRGEKKHKKDSDK